LTSLLQLIYISSFYIENFICHFYKTSYLLGVNYTKPSTSVSTPCFASDVNYLKHFDVGKEPFSRGLVVFINVVCDFRPLIVSADVTDVTGVTGNAGITNKGGVTGFSAMRASRESQVSGLYNFFSSSLNL
jgi:hypothetical protein